MPSLGVQSLYRMIRLGCLEYSSIPEHALRRSALMHAPNTHILLCDTYSNIQCPSGTAPFWHDAWQHELAHERSKAAWSNAFIQLSMSETTRAPDCSVVLLSFCQCMPVIQAVFKRLTFDSRFEISAVCCSSCSFTASCTCCSPANSSSRFFSCDLQCALSFCVSLAIWLATYPHT